jgi:hypothetical protein
MKIVQDRIDQSVHFLTQTTKDTPMKNNIILKLQELKSALVKRLSAEYAGLEARLVWQAVNEAHALAATTFAPILVMPDLAEEKVQRAAEWSNHQRALRRHDFFARSA